MTTTPTLQQLQRGLAIAEQIAALEKELAGILDNPSAPVAKAAATQSDGRKGKRSPATIAKMKASQKARWAKVTAPAASKAPAKAAKKAPATAKATTPSKAPAPAKKKPTMSAEAKAKLSALMKAKWEAKKAASSSTAAPIEAPAATETPAPTETPTV